MFTVLGSDPCLNVLSAGCIPRTIFFTEVRYFELLCSDLFDYSTKITTGDRLFDIICIVMRCKIVSHEKVMK